MFGYCVVTRQSMNSEGSIVQRNLNTVRKEKKCKNLFGNDLQYAVMSEYEVHTYLHREHLFSITLLITTTLFGGKLTVYREKKVSKSQEN